MSDEAIKKVFFNIGEQSGNLDRLFVEYKGGILYHGDPHAYNFLYDETSGKLYWIDTAGTKIQKALSSLEGDYLWWFGTRINHVGGLGQLRGDMGYDFVWQWRLMFEPLDDAVRRTINNLNPQEKKTMSEINLRYLEVARGMALDNFQFVVSKISENDRQEFIKNFKERVVWIQKDLLALKSFGEGYVKAYPAAKDIFNNAVTSNEDWQKVTMKLSNISKILGLGDIKFVDPIQK